MKARIVISDETKTQTRGRIDVIQESHFSVAGRARPISNTHSPQS
jgi:hypothetical protein